MPVRAEDADVVVLGAGVAGLLVASELAERHSVLVIERAPLLPRNKYWLTDRPPSHRYDWLAEAVDVRYDRMEFRAHDDHVYTVYGDYVLWSTDRLLGMLQGRLTEAGGVLALGHTFYSYRRESNHLELFVDDQRFRCRLVVDCMGFGSPIIYAEGVLRVDGYYLVHGATFRRAEDLVPVAFHNLMLSDRPAYVEAFPTGDGLLHLILISPATSVRPTSSLESDFRFISERSPYSRFISSQGGRPKILGGIVPVGRMRGRARDRIAFFGESGQANPAASATALSRMLHSCHDFCAGITDALECNALGGRALEQRLPPIVDRLNTGLQRALFREMLGWRSGAYAAVLRELSRLDDASFVNAFMFGQVRARDAVRYAAALWRARARRLLWILGRGALRAAI